MSQSKRNNIIFYSSLCLVVILSILGTFFAIKYHNKNVNKNKVANTPIAEKIIPYLDFKEVTKSNTVDVFKKYPINPIKLNHESNNKVTISGLKNKEVQNKINEKLSVLNDEKTKNGESLCYFHFNVSNVLSISCNGEKTVNLNLVTGDEITLEDIFNKDSDIYSILVKSNYDNLCSWWGCYPEAEANDEWPSEVENKLVENLKKIKNKEYNLTLFDDSVRIEYDDDYEDGSGTFINYYDFSDEITIYDRFIDDSIYENTVTDYCEAGSCYEKQNYSDKDMYIGYEYLNDKVYLSYQISNDTDQDALFEYRTKETIPMDIEKVSKVIKEEIIKNENLNIKGNNYIEYDITVNIYYHTANDFQVTYSVIKNEFNKENFKKYRLGFYEAKTISKKIINKINMLIDKESKISYLSDNPARDIPNFESKLYDYIINDIKTSEFDHFSSYNTCEFSDEPDCEEKRDYHNLIKEASYAIDTVNNRLHMYEYKPGIAMAESYVAVYIPLDIFKDKVEEDSSNNSETNETPDENINDNVTENKENTNETN